MNPPTEEAPAPAAPRPEGRLRRWLFRRADILSARTEAARPSPSQQALLARARTVRELAFRIEEPVDPPPGGHGLEAARELYRQAAYWALLAHANLEGQPSPAELWAAASASLPGPTGADDVLAFAFSTNNAFVASREEPEHKLRDDVRALRDLVDTVLDSFDAPPRKLRRLLVWRAVRLGMLGVFLVALAAVAATLLMPARPDLAAGKPWKTSSTLHTCQPASGDCGGVRTRILFHTKEESSPWFEVDLGGPTEFSALTVRNRQDFGPERAVPLVVELSQDGQAYRGVLRRDKSFRIWRPEFGKETARYVRLRATRRTMLHLEGVQVHP